jgi:hypothetical protein
MMAIVDWEPKVVAEEGMGIEHGCDRARFALIASFARLLEIHSVKARVARSMIIRSQM